MTEEQIVLALIRDTIAQAPPDDRAAIENAVAKMRAIVDAYPFHAQMALALLGAELAAK